MPVQLFFENLDTTKGGLEAVLSSNLPNLICYLSFIQYDHTLTWAAVFGSDVKQSIVFTIGFHNHGESLGPSPG